MLDFRDHSHAEYGHATLSLKNARNKSIRLEIKYNLKKKKKKIHIEINFLFIQLCPLRSLIATHIVITTIYWFKHGHNTSE